MIVKLCDALGPRVVLDGAEHVAQPPAQGLAAPRGSDGADMVAGPPRSARTTTPLGGRVESRAARRAIESASRASARRIVMSGEVVMGTW